MHVPEIYLNFSDSKNWKLNFWNKLKNVLKYQQGIQKMLVVNFLKVWTMFISENSFFFTVPILKNVKID